jgi:hypothetical protein
MIFRDTAFHAGLKYSQAARNWLAMPSAAPAAAISLSISIGIYRPQATFFDGIADGKNLTPSNDRGAIHILTRARNN